MNKTSEKSANLKSFLVWREKSIENSSFSCEEMPILQSKEWFFEEGRLRHKTGGFFSLIGIMSQARHSSLHNVSRLIILQPEIAINGFLVRRTARGQLDVLFNGRVEPGNVGVMQLAPTVQSTEANFKRLHGGAATPMIDWFLNDDAGTTLYDERQSEEGTRYYGKYNRNVVIEAPTDAGVEISSAFRWYDLDAIREFCITENALNTDSRSVLCCLSWDQLAGIGKAFTGDENNEFQSLLHASYYCDAIDWDHNNEEIMAWLSRLRVYCALRQSIIPLEALRNWKIKENSIEEIEPHCGFAVRHFRIKASGREVGAWDQPLIDSVSCGRVLLVCQQHTDMLRFLVKASYEVGYLEGVQLSTTIMVAPGEGNTCIDAIGQTLVSHIDVGERSTVRLQCRQSEEGGRFYHDENNYQLAEIDPGWKLTLTDDYRWFTLAQIRSLIRVPGIFSIELRGVLTLLLHHL